MSQKILTLEQIYREGVKKLKEAAVAEADLDAWYLLEDITGISKASYYGNPKKELTEEQAEHYFEHIATRANRVPLQHITGKQTFMGLEFKVNEHVLIPRQDTENLVESAMKVLKPGMKVLDVCTGSGCILLSLMKLCQDIEGTGCDISEDALKIASENAKCLEVDAQFVHSDLFEEIEGKFDVIVSNPPYIPTKVIEGLEEEVRGHDPMLALDGKEDGLHFYRRIVADSVHYINDGGYLMFEIGHDQGESVSNLMKKMGYKEVTVKKDLAGLDRVVVGMYNGK